MADAIRRAIGAGSLITAMALAVHYLCFYLFGAPLWTEIIGEWIMARTPNTYSVMLLEGLGVWAKPFAVTGGLAALGFATSAAATVRRGVIAVAVLAVLAAAYHGIFEYPAVAGSLSFWAPAALLLLWFGRARQEPFSGGRRVALQVLMGGATAAVAVESKVREQMLADSAVKPVPLWAFSPPADSFAPGLVRKAVTPVGPFYTMSKNSVDPALHPSSWTLQMKINGQDKRKLNYAQILQIPREQRYVTLRCVSNTLKSDLMGTAEWSGFPLKQIISRADIPASVTEVAFIGSDGHGDSLPVEYAFSDEVMLAVGMNGQTLSRAHGFPIRLLCPRYYGFKNVKWITEISFVDAPYYGTWPKMGYTKEPLVKVASYIDKARIENGKIRMGGVSYAGSRGIRAVEVRAAGGEWMAATLDKPLSPWSWTRWTAEIPVVAGAGQVEARAQDGTGTWQLDKETPLFPAGVGGPTVRKLVG